MRLTREMMKADIRRVLREECPLRLGGIFERLPKPHYWGQYDRLLHVLREMVRDGEVLHPNRLGTYTLNAPSQRPTNERATP